MVGGRPHEIRNGTALSQVFSFGFRFGCSLFGTFNNPRNYENETGFYDGASKRVVDMLLFRNVDQPNQQTN